MRREVTKSQVHIVTDEMNCARRSIAIFEDGVAVQPPRASDRTSTDRGALRMARAVRRMRPDHRVNREIRFRVVGHRHQTASAMLTVCHESDIAVKGFRPTLPPNSSAR